MDRDRILANIRRNKPRPQGLPETPQWPASSVDAVEQFAQSVVTGGGRVFRLEADADVAGMVREWYPGVLVSAVAEVVSDRDLPQVVHPIELADVDVAVIPSSLGVAENGAVWVRETDSVHRVLPFIAQHLVVLIDPADIVPTMHDAYARIRIGEHGFGVFIAGPSKTADIEQALVIGAQGARSLTVLLSNHPKSEIKTPTS